MTHTIIVKLSAEKMPDAVFACYEPDNSQCRRPGCCRSHEWCPRPRGRGHTAAWLMKWSGWVIFRRFARV